MTVKKIISISVIVIFAAGLVLAGGFYYYNLRGVWTALQPAPADIAVSLPSAETRATSSVAAEIDNGPLAMPPGFQASIFAKDLPGARVIIFDRSGNIWLSETGAGNIVKLSIESGRLAGQRIVYSGLQRPHGLAFDPENPDILFIAEETRISRADVSSADPALEKIIDLPKGGNHFTRTLGFGPDGRLYVSIGSTCNVCYESDPRYAAIYSLNKDGSDFRQVAKGLRNAVFFIWNPGDGKMWATDMGRDLLGDDLPPDTVDVIDTASMAVQDFGWPICYGKNIHDTNFDKKTYVRNPCMEPFTMPSRIDLQAHSAPLGLAFVPANSPWPDEYRNNLIIAFHGSWNRSVPTGYKVVRLILDGNGQLVEQKDFITGWLTGSGALGRPVDMIFDDAGAMYLTDDKAGLVYKVEYKR